MAAAGTMCEGHGGEAWSFARRPKQQEMTSRAPFAATYGTFRPVLDVLLIHLLEATDVTLPGESTLVRRILDDRTAATSAPSGRGAAPPALLSITMREVAFSRRRAGARMIGALGVVAVGQMAAQPTVFPIISIAKDQSGAATSGPPARGETPWQNQPIAPPRSRAPRFG